MYYSKHVHSLQNLVSIHWATQEIFFSSSYFHDLMVNDRISKKCKNWRKKSVEIKVASLFSEFSCFVPNGHTKNKIKVYYRQNFVKVDYEYKKLLWEFWISLTCKYRWLFLGAKFQITGMICQQCNALLRNWPVLFWIET